MSESLEEERLRIQRQIEQLERTLSGAHDDTALSLDSSTDDEEEDDDGGDEVEEEPVNDAVSLSEQRLQVQREIQQLESALGQDSIILSDEDDDSDESGSGSELDLPENTESCLQMNMVYQQILQEKLQQIETLLRDNKLQQREVEAQLSGQRVASTSQQPRSSSQPAKLFMGRFLKPYFKDKLTGLGPPANPESKEKARNMTLYLDSKRMKLKRWEGWQKTLLIHAVAEDRMKRLIKPKLNKIDYLTQKLSSSQKVDTKNVSEQEDIQQQIDQLEKDILLLKVQNEEELVGDRYDNHDWEKISNIDFEGTREAQDICRFWENVLHPSINKTRWSQEEIDRLEEISKEHQERDWEKIAQELGTNRTAFMCLQMYQRYVSKTFKNNYWTEEEDQALIELVEKMRMGNFIPYTQMSYFMEGREPVQLLYRWNGVLDPSIRKGPWIPEEDELLLKAVSRFGEKNWWRIRMEVPGRTDGACRDRYYDCLKPGTKRGPFDENERRLLLMLVQKHGVGRWSKIAAEIPNRIDCQCMREWRKCSGQGPVVVKKGRKKRGPLNNEASQEAATTTTRQRRQRTAPATRRKQQAANEAGQQAAPPPRRRRQAAKTTGKRRRKRIKRESDEEEEEEISVEESGDETQLVYMDTDTDEEDKKAVIRKVKQRRGGEEVETQEREGGGEVQIEESLGAEEVLTEETQGGEEVQIDKRQGGEGLETQERGGGEEAQTEERRGMEVLTEDKRGVEKAVQTEARLGVEKEVTEVQAVQKVKKKEHPLPPMEEWIPRTRVGKGDALKGCLVSRPEPCSSSSSDHTTSDSPTAVRSTIMNRCGFLVESLLGQAPKPLPRWRRHQPTALIQLSRTQLNSLMQRKASSVANRGADWVMQFRLMAAVTPWIGNLLLPTPWTRRSAADHLRERAEGRHLSSTSVFLLLLRTLHVDLAGCKTAIEQMTGGKKSGSFCVPTPSLKHEPKQQVQQLVVQQQPTLLQRHQQQHVKYLLQQQRQQQQQQLVHQVQAHTSQQQEVTRQPCPQSLQPHHLQLVTRQPKTSNTPPPPWMIPPHMPPHVLMPMPPNMLQYLSLMRPGMCTKLPPLPFPFRSVPQTRQPRQPLAVSMSPATTVSMSPSTPVSVSPSTPVTMSSSTPVTISHTPVTPSSNVPVSMPTPPAVQAVPLPHDPSAVPPSLPNSHVSRASAAASIPGQPSVPSETTSHASSPAEETPSGRKRQRKLTEKVKLLQEDAAAKVEAKEKKMVTPKKQARKKQKIGPDFMPPGQTLWKMTVDGLVQVVSGEDVPPGLKLPLPAISGRSTPARNVSFQQPIPSPNSSTNKTQTPHSHAPPTSVPPQSASSPLPGGIHPAMLNFFMVPPPPGPSAGSSSQPQRRAAPTSPYAIRPVFHNVQICPPAGASPAPSGSPFQPHPPPPSVQPPAASSSSPLPVGTCCPAFHDNHARPPTGAPRSPLPGPSPAPTGSSFQPRPPPLRQPHTPARPLSFCLLRPGSHPLPRFPSPPVSAVRTPFKGAVNAAPRTPPVGSRPVFQGHHVRPSTGPPRGPLPGPSPVPSASSFQPRLPPLPQPHPPAPLTLFRPGSPLPRFPGPVRGTVDATPRTPPRLKIELSQLDPSLMFAEPGAEVERWMSGYGGVTVPGSNVALPYLPPFISNLRTLCALLKAKRLLVDKALHILPQSRSVGPPRPGPNPATTPGPFPDHDYIQTTQLAPEGDERVAAVRHLVAQRFAANPAYQLLKARFLSCFTVPALLATIQPIIDPPESCTANEEESSSEEEEELRVGGANDELRGGEEEEELRGGEAEEELRDGEEENGHTQNPLLLMQGAPATHYSGMTTRRTSRLQATEPPQTTSRLLPTEPPQTGPMDTQPEQ